MIFRVLALVIAVAKSHSTGEHGDHHHDAVEWPNDFDMDDLYADEVRDLLLLGACVSKTVVLGPGGRIQTYPYRYMTRHL